MAGDEGRFHEEVLWEIEMGGELAVDIPGDDGVDGDVAGSEILAEAGEVGGEGGLCAAVDEIAFAAADAGEGREADDAFEVRVTAVGGDDVEDGDGAGVEDVDHLISALPTAEGFFVGDLEAGGVEDDVGFYGEAGVEGGVFFERRGVEVAGDDLILGKVMGLDVRVYFLRLREAAMTW